MASGQEIQTKREFSGNGCTTINSLKETRFLLITKYDHIIDLEEDSRICSLQKPDWMKTFFIDDTTSRVAYGGSSNLSVTGLAGADPLVMEGVNRQNVISVALHPNGRLLAAAFDDHTIHIWDISTQKELMRLFGHTNQITDLRFTPDGTLLVSTSLDGTIRLWGIPD
jgi:WD40 repeat protein